MESQMRLILIRHAEPQQNFSQIISGPIGCKGLTNRGFQQAQVLTERLRSTGEVKDCSIFLSSPLLRAQQTAQILGSALSECVLQEEPGLCELLPGETDGLSKTEAQAKYGSFNLVAFPTRPIAPGGESWLDFNQRVRATLQKLADQFSNQTVVAVTHAGFIVVAMITAFDIPRPGTGAFLDPDLTGITEWQVSDGKWKLLRYNDCSHLIR
jgi:broad specificity phosphatase PhoE